VDLSKLELERLGPNLNRSADGQVTHGLNLVLKLKNHVVNMPLVLAKIRQAQRKIDDGLSELNFVHYARFLPTYDNTALQVITEFDGPLAPYVLDFVIEIGDIFDTLLGFTAGTENIVPVAEHPAEFLAFVAKHNTVTVPVLGDVPDWPLYAAYPDRTVVDIVGPRRDLPVPKSDRWPTDVDRNDVQGNILKGFNGERVRHFVLGVLDATKARAWLAGRATSSARSAAGVPKVTSFKPWRAKPKLMFNIGLTFNGMTALGLRRKWCDPFPEAFKQGALQRALDNFDVDSNGPENWWLGGPNEAASIHVMVSLYHAPGGEPEFSKAAAALTASLAAGGLQLLAEHDAVARDGRSWFGYVDSIANPRIAVPCPVPGERDQDLQPAATPGEFILGAKHKNVYGGPSLGNLPEQLATNGSFCVVRVLAQNTALFAKTLKNEAGRLGVDEQWLAAKLMGRWFEGAPLIRDPASPTADPVENERNDFDYAPSYEYPAVTSDHFGQTCPVGAHIRRVNPRTSRVAGARYARRLMRRGMHYENIDANGNREAGLFGLFMCADLERQFEFIQRQWINGDRFAAGLRGTSDPFIGTPRPEGQRFEIPMAGRPALEVQLPQLVQTRGSLYLFMPGLEALASLDRFATSDPPRLAPVIPAAADPGESVDVADGSLHLTPYVTAVTEVNRFRDALEDIGATITDADLLSIASAGVGAAIAPSAALSSSSDTLVFNPRRRDFQIDPYPTFATFRRREPVHFSPLFDGWFVFGYDDVLSICTDNAAYSAAEIGTTEVRGLFTLDDPQHAEIRKQVASAWNQGAINAASFVLHSIARTLGALSGRDCFDLVDDLARPIPRDVYFDILGGTGIKPDERIKLDQLARKVMKHHDHTMDEFQQWDGMVAGIELVSRLGSMLLLAKLGKPSYKGTFLAYLAKEVDWLTGPFNPKIALLTLLNLTVAGYMSVEFLLATGIRRLLLEDGKFWRVLQQDPASVDKLLREMRRTSHALSVVDRFAKQDVTLSGVKIRQGARVFGVLASANRDEHVYGADADVFNPDRAFPKPHLGLGAGAHECMGRALEHMITVPTLAAVATQMPGLRLESKAEPPWFENFYFRSFDHLKVSMR